jgi:hypothetical protein
MISTSARRFRSLAAAILSGCLLFAGAAYASPLYTFQTLNNAGDPNFNQLLGIDSTASPTIVGYFGDGVIAPNQGYTLVAPYNSQASYTNENFPGSVQTQVVGVEPNNSKVTVGVLCGWRWK